MARFVTMLACFLGLFASGYLFYTYVTGTPITCAIVSGCDQVRASKWAYTFGIPRPFLGLLFYTAVLALLIVRVSTDWQKKLLYRLTMGAAVIAFIESGFLFVIQWLDVKAFCFWCLLSAVASVALLAAAPFDRIVTDEEITSARELRQALFSMLAFAVSGSIGFLLLIRR